MTEHFHHKLDDGREITLPRFDQIPFGVVRKLRNQDDAEQLFGLLEQVADDGTLDIIDTLTMAEIEPLFTAWQEAAQFTAGEPSAK